jgi:hypothetical protein
MGICHTGYADCFANHCCVEFYSKNKFEKLVHIVGFTVRTNMTCCGFAETNVQQFMLSTSAHLYRWKADFMEGHNSFETVHFS